MVLKQKHGRKVPPQGHDLPYVEHLPASFPAFLFQHLLGLCFTGKGGGAQEIESESSYDFVPPPPSSGANRPSFKRISVSCLKDRVQREHVTLF